MDKTSSHFQHSLPNNYLGPVQSLGLKNKTSGSDAEPQKASEVEHYKFKSSEFFIRMNGLYEEEPEAKQ